MTAYYNENEPYAAQWLRNLIGKGLISDGHVDDRSIEEVDPADLVDYQQCHFFAGLGGWSAALRLAGVPDDTPLWTGSCPCQPFSLAGRQDGFADIRHLWPVWQRLIAQCRPAIVLGEQVASAAQWLGLVRGDLEALGYAVGIIPVEAASAGAYHLRDRYWFVADDGRGRRVGPGRRQGQQPRRAKAVGAGDPNGMGDTGRPRLALGSVAAVEPGTVRQERPTTGASGHRGGVADAARQRLDRGEDTGGTSGRGSVENGGAAVDLADPSNERTGFQQGLRSETEQRHSAEPIGSDGSGELSWVVGADGKARRVEPGIRLLAHGVPQRVAKLRALGNAIDLRPAAAFIKAALDR